MKKINMILFFVLFFVGSSFCVMLSTEKVGFVDMNKVLKESEKSTFTRTEINTKKNDMKRFVANKEAEIKVLKNEYDVLFSSMSFLQKELETLEAEKVEVSTSVKTNVLPVDTIVSTSTASTISTIDPQKIIEKEKAEKAAAEKQQEKAKKIQENKNNIEKHKNRKQEIEKDLETKRQDLENFKVSKQKEFDELEESYKHNILGELYDAIEIVATRHSCSVVVNKEEMIYSNSIGDITDEVLEELKVKR